MDKPMHDIQTRMLQLAVDHDVANMALADIGRRLGVKHLQQVKHHRMQLQKAGYLQPTDPKKIRTERLGNLELLVIPVLGEVR